MSQPDFILINGNIHTGDLNNPRAESFASENGVITAVGTNRDILRMKKTNTMVYDAENRLILPGFTDSHLHFTAGGMSLIDVNLSGVSSRKEFSELLSAHGSSLKKNEWMCGSGWDDTKFSPDELNPGTGMPDSTWIDTVCADRPVYLLKYDMHSALANKKALELAGITSETANPFGGSIEKDPESGEPTGILKDTAMKIVEKRVPEPDSETRKKALLAACREAARNGITAVHDMSKFEELDPIADAASDSGFTVRLRSYPPIAKTAEVVEKQQTYNNQELLERFRIAGVKAFSDGSLGSYTAYFFKEYADSPGNFGLPNDILLPENNLSGLLDEADSRGMQVVIHAIGDRANSTVLDFYSTVIKKNGVRDRRWRIEHAQHVRHSDVKRYAELGVIASMQPYHLIIDTHFIEKRIGSERCREAYVFNSFVQNGVKIAFGSDWTVAPLNPIDAIDAAVNRIPVGGSETWYPLERISVGQAVECYTTVPAYAAFDELYYGMIKPGLFADCVVLSQDLFTIQPEEIRETEPVATIFGGNIVYEK